MEAPNSSKTINSCYDLIALQLLYAAVFAGEKTLKHWLLSAITVNYPEATPHALAKQTHAFKRRVDVSAHLHTHPPPHPHPCSHLRQISAAAEIFVFRWVALLKAAVLSLFFSDPLENTVRGWTVREWHFWAAVAVPFKQSQGQIFLKSI